MGIPFDLGAVLFGLFAGWIVLSGGAFVLIWAAVYMGSGRRRAKQSARQHPRPVQSTVLPVATSTLRDARDKRLVHQPVAMDHM